MRWLLWGGARAVVTPLGALATLALVFGPLSPQTSAWDGTDVVCVEEDWELVVDEPDATTNSPQVTCVTSPVGHVNGVYVAFDLNHHSLTDYYSGGLQLQLWHDDVPLSDDYPRMYNLLSSTGEVVTWTQRMRLGDERLRFEVVNGLSSSWGAFGGSTLSVSVETNLENLNQYSPDVSVANSGVGFGGNRVERLALKRVRLYKANGQVDVREVNAVVHQY